MIKTLTTIGLVLLYALSSGAHEPPTASKEDGVLKAELVEVHKIWAPDSHCMRTDLVRYRGQWFCRFQNSNPTGGETRVSIIHSKDGRSWKSAALLSKAGLPSSRFSVKSNEHLNKFSHAAESARLGPPTATGRGNNWTNGLSTQT